MRHRRIIAALLLAAALAGCARSTAQFANPTHFPAGDYDLIFNAAIAELRERRFVVDRQDRRMGVVTTEPQTASTLLEPWYRDDTTMARVGESTFNADRRVIVVTLAPHGEVESDAPPLRYGLGVEVRVERRQLPPRQLTSSVLAPARLAGRHRDRYHRAVRTEEGREEVFWRSIDRDEAMEQRLIEAILKRAF